jgi:hypothetical protein
LALSEWLPVRIDAIGRRRVHEFMLLLATLLVQEC